MLKEFPVINSTLAETALGEYIQKKYILTESASCKLFRAAMNHLYIITDGGVKYVFRVYTHNWRTKPEINEELRLLNHLKADNKPIAFPIADRFNELIQEFDAPEGKRFGVLFSYAKGVKTAKFSAEASYYIGRALAKVHGSTINFPLDRIHYKPHNLLDESLHSIKQFFGKTTDEICFLESVADLLRVEFDGTDKSKVRYGVVHLDVWFDNLHISDENEITFFDFDFCGNGELYLDISYFLFQLLATNLDENAYRDKAESFLQGYNSVVEISKEERRMLPYGCLAIMIYYIGVQCDRFNYWTNIFVNEDHLKRMVGNLKRWMNFNNIGI